jgi:hypothetical protein
MAASDNSPDRNEPVAVGQDYFVRHAAVSEFISDLGIFAKTCVDRFLMNTTRSLKQAIGVLFVAAVE